MKRCRTMDMPQSWPVPDKEPVISRPMYKYDLPTYHSYPRERRDSFGGIIDSALVAPTSSSSHGAGRNSKPMPPSLSPFPFRRDGHLNNVHSGDMVSRSNDYQSTLPSASSSHNTLEDVSANTIPHISQIPHNHFQMPVEKASYEKVKAEIDEMLSPVSECLERNATPFPPIQGPPHMFNIAPLMTTPQVPKIPSLLPSQIPTQGADRRAMQEILTAISTPSKRSRSGRKRAPASTQCNICGKVYTESSNLSKHIRTVHLKLRPFRCHLCTSSFAEKNKLGKHILSVHEHARPYKCELCNATFSQASDRKRHRLVLHEGCRPYVCQHCGKAFGRRSSLTQHCHRVHKIPRPTPPTLPVLLQPPQRHSTTYPSNTATHRNFPSSNPP